MRNEFENISEILTDTSTSFVNEKLLKNEDQNCFDLFSMQDLAADLDRAKDHLHKLEKEMNFEWEVTGALGKRTLHQERDTVHLIVVRKSDLSSSTEINKFMTTETNVIDVDGLNNVNDFLPTLPPVTSFLDYPRLTETYNTKFGIEEQKILLLHAICQIRNEPIENLAVRQQVRPFIECILIQKAIDPVIKAICLYWRSKFDSFEKSSCLMERAGHQLKLILLQYHQLSKSSFLPSKNEMASLCIDCYLKCGLFEEALSVIMQQKLSFFFINETIKCYVALGKNKELLEFIIQNDPEESNPELLFWKFYATTTPSLLEKSWNLSKKTFFKSILTLAKYHSSKGEYQQALDCYLEALHNECKFTAENWVDCGFCQLNLLLKMESMQSFKKAVALDADCYVAWSNISLIQFKMENFKDAFGSIKNAIKGYITSVEMWNYYITIAAKIEEWREAIYGIEKIAELNGSVKNQIEYLEAHCNGFKLEIERIKSRYCKNDSQ